MQVVLTHFHGPTGKGPGDVIEVSDAYGEEMIRTRGAKPFRPTRVETATDRRSEAAERRDDESALTEDAAPAEPPAASSEAKEPRKRPRS